MASDSSMPRRGWARPIVAAFFSALPLGGAMAATITIEGVNCVSAQSSADGSGNVTITCGAATPAAPVLGTVTPGSGSATIAFTPGSGAAATSYTATCTDGSTTRVTTGAASPLVVTGLDDGTTYTCSVTASNAAGTSSSSASLAVQPHGTNPATAPGAPTIGAATPGDASADIAFSPPAVDGFTSPILDYRANCTPSATATASESPIRLSDLTNGTTYTCSVSARNAVGYGPASDTVTVTPALASGASTPSEPTGLSATPGNGSATISFSPPASNGGLMIEYYTATCDGIAVSSAASPILVFGLTNDVQYNCTVRAFNAQGYGPAALVSVTPTAPLGGNVPGTPTGVTATAGNAKASIAFTPGTLGSGRTSQYRVSCDNDVPAVTGTSSPILVTGLENGQPYTCTVAARNVYGWSAESEPTTFTPNVVPPSAPTIGTATAGNAQISVAFTPESLGTGTLIRYTAKCGDDTGPSANGTSSPITVSGLSNGTAYTCRVQTTTTDGTSGWSANSNSVTPTSGPTVPGAPFIGTASAGDASASVAFTAPASNGGAAIDSYRATCGTQSATGASSPITVTGLTNGASYTCTVQAHNSVGWGPASASSNAVTPAGGNCGPGEVFNQAAGDLDWSDFNTTSTPFPGVAPSSFQASGSAGRAVRFVPNGAINGGIRGVQLLNGYGTGATEQKEIVISSCPHNFTSVPSNHSQNTIRCRITATQYLTLHLYSGGGSPTKSNQCVLTSGQTYYINARPASQSGETSVVLVPMTE